MSISRKYLIAAFLAFILGLNLYFRSDQPPYSYPQGELSDNYWGIITDIAHKWRSFDFSFWNRGLGGGVSLFSSGHYPVLNPTNFLAWFLNDNQFYLFKLIEPYCIGFFFMMILLWDVFETRMYVAVFGALGYTGLILSKTSFMSQSPFFLYGCGFLPAMILAFLKLSQRHIYLCAATVGALLALQFSGQGVTQFPQMVIWWVLLFTFHLAHEWFLMIKQKDRRAGLSQNIPFLKTWGMTILIFCGMAVGLWAVQFIPTYDFFIHESSRGAGHYPINNFSIFRKYPGFQNMTNVLIEGFILSGPIRAKAPVVLVLVCLALAVVHFGQIFTKVNNRKFIYQAWATIILFFLISPAAAQLAEWFPSLNRLFSPLTYISFSKGLHILDFCLMISLCLIINDDGLSFFKSKVSFLRKGLGELFLFLAFLVALAPTILFLLRDMHSWFDSFPFLYFFTPNTLANGLKLLGKSLVLIFVLMIRPRRQLVRFVSAFVLVMIGFMIFVDCFKYYDKGQRTHFEEYQWTSPEHEYFRHAKGKYVHLYDPWEPLWMTHDYNLLYGVHGTAGFLPVPPQRFMKFLFYYEIRNNQGFEKVPYVGGGAKFHMKAGAPSAVTTYFPIDFTVIRKGVELPWEGFGKVVSGEKHDVYERLRPTPRVYFANHLETIDFFKMIRQFDVPRRDTLYVVTDDAREFDVTPSRLDGDPAKARYHRFMQKQEDRLSFEVETTQETFVIVPECYQKGWQVRVDGHRVPLFPAYYLFMGFKVPGGNHFVELNFLPPGLWVGLCLNILSVLGMAVLIKKF